MPWETLSSPRLGSLPLKGASVRSPGPSYCPCSSESQPALAAKATTGGGRVFLSLKRGKGSVVSGLEQCPRHGGALPEGSSLDCGCCLLVSRRADSRVNNALCMLLRDS